MKQKGIKLWIILKALVESCLLFPIKFLSKNSMVIYNPHILKEKNSNFNEHIILCLLSPKYCFILGVLNDFWS